MDLNLIKDAIYVIVVIGSIVGLYWKLRMSRPTYQKVEEMIKDHAFSLENGIRLEEKFKAATTDIKRLEQKIDGVAVDVKTLLIETKREK